MGESHVIRGNPHHVYPDVADKGVKKKDTYKKAKIKEGSGAVVDWEGDVKFWHKEAWVVVHIMRVKVPRNPGGIFNKETFYIGHEVDIDPDMVGKRANAVGHMNRVFLVVPEDDSDAYTVVTEVTKD